MLSKVTFPHTSLPSGGYNLAYNHTRKHTGDVLSRVGIFLTVTPVDTHLGRSKAVVQFTLLRDVIEKKTTTDCVGLNDTQNFGDIK